MQTSASKGTFFAVARNSNVGACSTDGQNWTQFTLPKSTKWEQLAYNKGRLLVLAYSYWEQIPFTMLYSDDNGKNWDSVSFSHSFNGPALCAGGDRFFIADNYPAMVSGGSGTIWQSSDGLSWSQCATIKELTPYGLRYGNGIYVLGGSAGYGVVACYSPDGISWSKANSVNKYAGILKPFFKDGVFYGCRGGNTSYKSTDGKVWTAYTTTNIYNQSPEAPGLAVEGDGIYLLVHSSTKTGNYVTRYVVSQDLVNWTELSLPEAPSKVCYGNGLFVMMGQNTNKTYNSKDGRTWIPGGNLPLSQNWSDIIYGGNE